MGYVGEDPGPGLPPRDLLPRGRAQISVDLAGEFKATDVVGSRVKFVTVRGPSPKYLDLVLRDASSCSGMGSSSTEGVAVVLLGVDAAF